MNAIGRVQRDHHAQAPALRPTGNTGSACPSDGVEAPEATGPTSGSTTVERIDTTGRGPIDHELRGADPVSPVTVRRLEDRNRVSFSVLNDNGGTIFGQQPRKGPLSGNDFGPTVELQAEVKLCGKDAYYILGLSTELNTKEIGPRRPGPNGKELATQAAIEISKLYFAIELSPKSDGYTRLFGGVGLRNGQRELPGLAMWFQNRWHEMLPRAPVFDNEPTEPMTPFLEVGGAAGFNAGITEKLRIRGEVGASLNTIFSGSRAFALVEAEIPLAGPLKMRASHATEILANQSFNFMSSAGVSLEFPAWMIGIEAKLPYGDLDDVFRKYDDHDAITAISIMVALP